jgi:hypothetical protein
MLCIMSLLALCQLFSNYAESAWMIFVAKNIYVFVPNLCMLSRDVMLEHTSSELIMIFGLSEIIILKLCMFSVVI